MARGCLKKYYWKYVENIEPIRQSSSLAIGNVVHDCFEMFYKGSSDEECLKHIVDTFDEEISKSELSDQEELLISKYNAMGMWKFYPHKDLSAFEAILPEMSFRVRLGRSRDYLVGRMDGYVIKDRTPWIREVKTTGLSEGQFRGRMATSGQATCYVYAANKLKSMPPPAGVMFDVIRKSSLRKKQTETADEFGKRIYNDYRLRPDEHYYRHYEYRNPERVRLWEADMIDLCKDLRKRHRTNQWHRNTEQCWSFNAECPYLKVCFSEKPDPLTLELLYKGGSYGEGKGSEV